MTARNTATNHRVITRWNAGVALALLTCAGALLAGLPASAERSVETATITDERLSAGIPLGGIGTGKVELLSDGSFANLTLNGNMERPIADAPGSFFAVRAGSGTQAVSRLLASRSTYDVPLIGGVRYQGVFPDAALHFSDADLPVGVSLRAWSPLVAGNLKDSSLPAAHFTVTLSNPSSKPIESAVAFSWENLLGVGGTAREAFKNRTGNTQAIQLADGRVGLLFNAGQSPQGPAADASGQYALLAEGEGVKVQTLSSWNAAGDGTDFWNSFTGPTLFGEKPPARAGQEGTVHPAGAVAASVTVPAEGAREIHFVLAWYTPQHTVGDKDLGRYYANHFKDAWSVATYASEYRETLASGTASWKELLTKSSLPSWLRHQLLNDLHPLVSNSVLTREGRFSLAETASGGLGGVDQWLFTRPALQALFPALDRDELKSLRAVQGANGSAPRHFGSASQAFTAAGEATPDAAANYVLSTYRVHRTTGDPAFLSEAYPGVQRALAWLKNQDQDQDGLPEGATAFTTGPKTGTFGYTGGLYLTALRAGEAMARASQDRKSEDEYRDEARRVRATLVAQLWNGRYLNRSLNPTSGDRSSNLFTGMLAGEWAATSLGLGDTLDPEMTDSSIRTLLELQPSSGSLPPSEVRADGSPLPDSDLTHAAALQTYVAALAVARGHADAGIALARRVAAVRYAAGNSPWSAASAYGASNGREAEGRGSATSLATWNVYQALTGFVLDEPGGRLVAAPSVPASWNGLHAPLYGPRYWAWLDYSRNPNNAATNLRLKLVKKLDDRPVTLTSLTTSVAPGTRLDRMTLLVSNADGTLLGKPSLQDGRLEYVFKQPLEWRQGETLEMTLVPAEANNLVLSFGPSKVLTYGSVVTAKDLARTEQIRFTLVNPTRERQVVNVRFRGVQDRQFEVYQNGLSIPRFTPDTDEERLSITVPTSPIGFDRVEVLRSTAGRIRIARSLAAGRGGPIDTAFGDLPSRLDAAVAADEAARSSQIVMHPFRRLGLLKNKLKEPLPVVTAPDPEPLVVAAEAALAAAPKQVAAALTDPELRSLAMGALIPTRIALTASSELQPGRPMQLRAAIENASRYPVRVNLDLGLPAGWTGPTAPLSIRVAEGEEGAILAGVTPSKDAEARRVRLSGRATLSTTGGITWTVPVGVALGHSYVREWSLLGAWPTASLDAPLPPDTELDPGKTYEGRKWTVHTAPESRIDLGTVYGKTGTTAYAITQVFSPTEQEAVLAVTSDGGFAVRVNGEKLAQRNDPAASIEQVPVKLRQGWNTVVLKLRRSADPWTFRAEFLDRADLTPNGLRINPDLSK